MSCGFGGLPSVSILRSLRPGECASRGASGLVGSSGSVRPNPSIPTANSPRSKNAGSESANQIYAIMAAFFTGRGAARKGTMAPSRRPNSLAGDPCLLAPQMLNDQMATMIFVYRTLPQPEQAAGCHLCGFMLSSHHHLLCPRGPRAELSLERVFADS